MARHLFSTTVYLRNTQYDALLQLSRARGCPYALLVRAAVDHLLAASPEDRDAMVSASARVDADARTVHGLERLEAQRKLRGGT